MVWRNKRYGEDESRTLAKSCEIDALALARWLASVQNPIRINHLSAWLVFQSPLSHSLSLLPSHLLLFFIAHIFLAICASSLFPFPLEEDEVWGGYTHGS